MEIDRARQCAMLLQAIHDLDMEKAECMNEFKDRRTRLENSLDKLRQDILSGQMTLVPEPEPGKAGDAA